MRIDDAFRVKDPNKIIAYTEPIPIPSSTSDYNASDLKCSSSTHGILNPNYRTSPTSSCTSSRTSMENFGSYQLNATSSQNIHKSDLSSTYKKGIKKASLFAWMTLQSVPEETIISPHILEFLEQTLEPIPTKPHFNTSGKFLRCYPTVFAMRII